MIQIRRASLKENFMPLGRGAGIEYDQNGPSETHALSEILRSTMCGRQPMNMVPVPNDEFFLPAATKDPGPEAVRLAI